MVIGIDSHKETLAACAVDDVGRQEAVAEFPNSRTGHTALLDWALQIPGDHVFAIEGSGGFGRPLALHLLDRREKVVEVPSGLTARERRRLRAPGKSDPGDALAIARVALREEHLPQPARTGWSRSLRELVDYREQLVGERTRCANRLHADLIELSPGYQEGVKNLVSKRYLARTEILLADNSLTRAGLARRRLQAIRRLDREIAELKREITQMVEASGTNLTAITGISALGAARILGEVGDVRRFASKNHFASATGTAPVPASSGSIRRHRLNRGGNRRLNRAIHTIAIVQAQIDPRGRAYVERRRAEGKSWREALRCLKRHLSNVIFRELMAERVTQLRLN